MSPVTPPGRTRERVFQFVRKHLLQGQPPTVREVQEAFGFKAVQTAREHLMHLVAEGRLTHHKGRARGYALPARRQPLPAHLVPVLGRVQAGALQAAIEDADGYIPVQTRRTGQLFALRVRGESMIGAGILDGDLVVVRSQPTAHSGEIVVALIGDEATVKRLRLRRRRIELHPENPDFEIIVPDETCTILGKVIEVRRHLESAWQSTRS